MSKSNSFFKYLNNINKSINSLLEKNLNKLNLKNLRNLSKNNKIILTFVASIFLFTSYLLLPNFYNQSDISKELKNELSNKLNLNLNFSKKVKYNFFPRPHFISADSIVKDGENEVAAIKKIKIYVSLENLFSLKNIEVKDVIIENANFNLNKKNYDFFIKLMDMNFKDNYFKIKKSNIFFRNNLNEVLFINKIREMKYYHDTKDLKNILYSKNEIFNLPYDFRLYFDKDKKKILSKLNIDYFKLKAEHEINYKKDEKKGKINFILNKSKSFSNYRIKKKLFEFRYFDKLEDPSFEYKGKINFFPFYSSINGTTEDLNFSFLINSNSLFQQLLKTEIFNNPNIDFEFKIGANKIKNNHNFVKLIMNSKIKEGLIDFDNTSIEWKNKSTLKILESLIFVKNGELILDGKVEIDILDYNEIYKQFLTPKNYRKKISKINLNFTYNFDQNEAKFKDIRIDGKFNQDLSQIINGLTFKKDNLQNKIYLKRIFNEAFKSYAG